MSDTYTAQQLRDWAMFRVADKRTKSMLEFAAALVERTTIRCRACQSVIQYGEDEKLCTHAIYLCEACLTKRWPEEPPRS